nr:hypothetical protein [Tanacetum cinerariifolium]
YSRSSKAYIVLNKKTIRIKESLNVNFDESLSEPESSPSIDDGMINKPIIQDLYGSSSLQSKVLDDSYPKSVKEARGHLIKQCGPFDESLPDPNSSPSVEDDMINEPRVQDLHESPSLQVNVLDDSYPKSVREARGHPIEQVIGELTGWTLRTYVKGLEVRQHCCCNEMKDRCQYIIQTMVDIISDYTLSSLPEYTCKLGDNSKQQICLASMMDNLTLWHGRLDHANMRLAQNLASNKLVALLFYEVWDVNLGCRVAGEETRKGEETGKGEQWTYVKGLEVRQYFCSNEMKDRCQYIIQTIVDIISNSTDDRINKPIVQDLYGSPSIQVNVSGDSYPKSIEEARGHPIEQVIGELNEKTPRTYVKGLEVGQHCCANKIKDRCQYIIQTMVDFISDSTYQTYVL